MLTPIKYGNTNTYLVHGTTGNLLVDTDMAGTMQGFYRAIKALGVKLVIAQPQAEYVHYADEIFSRSPQLKYTPIDESQARIDAYPDYEALKADWEKVLSYSPRRICHAHANEVCI